jgi:hypothetical protein
MPLAQTPDDVIDMPDQQNIRRPVLTGSNDVPAFIKRVLCIGLELEDIRTATLFDTTNLAEFTSIFWMPATAQGSRVFALRVPAHLPAIDEHE